MLHLETVEPATLGLIQKIQAIPEIDKLRLVGGTGLALLYGHRKSIDIDLFGELETDDNTLIELLSQIGKTEIISFSKPIKILRLNGIKVDIVKYPYKWLAEPIFQQEMRIASDIDIAAMKLSAITNRGTKKDFVDLFFLLKKFSLQNILNYYTLKYPEAGLFFVLKSLSYFADADIEPMPYMFANVTWDEVKAKIQSEVIRYSKR